MESLFAERLARIQREIAAVVFEPSPRRIVKDTPIEAGHDDLPSPDAGTAMNEPGPSLASGQRRAEGPKPWSEAMRCALIQAALVRKGADASIRAIAREAGCSPGRVSELLQFRETFFDITLAILGDGEATRGERMLDRLTYREIRLVLSHQGHWARITMVRRLVGQRTL
jgi:hypothetical protein